MQSTHTHHVNCRALQGPRQFAFKAIIGRFSINILALITIALVPWIILSCGQESEKASSLDLGDKPGISQHISEEDLSGKIYSLEEIISKGEQIFTASFNTLDGSGNAKTRIFKDMSEKDNLLSRFNRISGPDANACSGCHNLPKIGGGGDNVANVFVLARRFPNVNFDAGPGDLLEDLTLRTAGNERGTTSMFGSGIIELIAREMTMDMQAIRDHALKLAKETQKPITAKVETKGVQFGKLTAWPDGLLDVSKIEGVDGDLIVKPFGQKGVYVSLREFTLDALELHHGLQPEERVGYNHDADLDGVVNELTTADVTALTLFQASLPPPTIEKQTNNLAISYVERGDMLFNNIGCAVCHKPFLELNDPIYSEPNPYNPPGTISVYSIPSAYSIDLASRSDSNTIKTTDTGTYRIYAYTDLKRHDMGPTLANETIEQRFVESSVWITRKLWGMMSEPPFLHHGRATIIQEAIEAHGGEAQEAQRNFTDLDIEDKISILEFIKTFQTPISQ